MGRQLTLGIISIVLSSPRKIFQTWCSEMASEAIFGSFFSFICSSWQAGFWFSLGSPTSPRVRQIPIYETVSTNAAPGTRILILKFAQPRKWQTLQPGPNYAAAASDERCSRVGPNYAGIIRHLSLQATSTQPARACGHSKNLGKSQNWSGHGLSNRTGVMKFWGPHEIEDPGSPIS